MVDVSIIIPAYNAEKTILTTIKSIQKQTCSNFELIVIDDGSTDKTCELLSTLSEPKLKVFSYKNGGLPVARNRGITHARGDYITFIDADDLWTPDKLELQLAALQESSEAGAAYSWTVFIDEEEKLLYAGKPLFFEGNIYPHLLVENFICSGSNILVRRQFIESTGEFDASLKSAEDWDYNIRLARQCHFVVVPKYQILYRKSSQAMSSKVDVMEKAILTVTDRAFCNAPAELQFLKNRSLAKTYQFFTKLYLEYALDRDGLKIASQRIQKAFQLYPRIALDKETQRIFFKLLLLQLLPYRKAMQLIKFFGENFPIISIQNKSLT
ncbi:glycosyltransferase [Gloeocapsopsis sp. IPPAS B-1203]|uniref:glycosyltransferase family 2 protein n=1 Tax=Gloeocapsopsis sp. IPPAS B-1203 TaxID=2049454 RepID=UPI000C1A8202|nr:glycosyltransferase [Gloeocapsopsis sp. IPPAS B-1203]PIG95297.1 glycosyl transferase family A [Gloeocapsopsis sp. IPPAS B-1203]